LCGDNRAPWCADILNGPYSCGGCNIFVSAPGEPRSRGNTSVTRTSSASTASASLAPRASSSAAGADATTSRTTTRTVGPASRRWVLAKRLEGRRGAGRFSELTQSARRDRTASTVSARRTAAVARARRSVTARAGTPTMTTATAEAVATR
jgi:hypothetical protein